MVSNCGSLSLGPTDSVGLSVNELIVNNTFGLQLHLGDLEAIGWSVGVNGLGATSKLIGMDSTLTVYEAVNMLT